MGYTAEIGSGAKINVLIFIKIGRDIQKLMGRDTQTHTQHGDRSLFFFKIKEVG
jgi:hypothetical protein